MYLKDIDYIVINDKINNIQRKNIEKELNVNVLDRNEIIIEIFNKNANNAESKIQVELAKLKYELPKLIGKGIELSRTGAGIGTVGPGETLLEYNRRNIKERINILSKKLKKISIRKENINKNKNNNLIPVISIAGYTCAGKSSLLSELSDDNNIKISDKLFSTLSTKTKKVVLPSGLEILITDTVGFIRNLPVELIEAFKTTLNDINNSDLIISIIDISEKDFEEKMEIINSTFEDILNKNIPIIKVFNKIDKLDDYSTYKLIYNNDYFLSCKSINSINDFLVNLEKELLIKKIIIEKEISIKYSDYWKVEKNLGKIGLKSKNKIDDGYSIKIIGLEPIIKKIFI